MRLPFKPFRRKIKYSFIYGLVKAVIWTSNALPSKVWFSLSGVLGRLSGVVVPNLRQQVITNLTKAYKHEKTVEQVHKLSGEVLEMLGKNAGAVLRASTISSLEEFNKINTTRGLEHAQRAYDRGRGVIFITAHLGPFESVATELSLRGYRPYIIGSPLKDPRLNSLVQQHRAKFGAVVIERGKETFRLMKNISSGGTIAILIDQDTKVKSVFVNFFGELCATPVGATMLALRTGAAVVPVFAKLKNDGRQEITYYPEVQIERTGDEAHDILVNTQIFTDIIEQEIRKYPEQWVWMHNRWKTKPADPEKINATDLQHH